MAASHAQLTGVTKIFPAAGGNAQVHALGPLDLSLARGEFFAVVGPSGCGKSTLLDLMAGLLPATQGTILFEDKPVAGRVPDGIGVVFQDDASFPWLSVRDNVAFGLRRTAIDNAELNKRVA
ncbi:MAG: ATP-binding cassette domain-containing protein, partial [Alphaproteobacteria bacterium]